MLNRLKILQEAVEQSKTIHQKRTGVIARATFLSTEVGEVQKEVLKLLGHYGREGIIGAKERIAQELCDVLWNVFDLANILDIPLESAWTELLERNKNRVWTDE